MSSSKKKRNPGERMIAFGIGCILIGLTPVIPPVAWGPTVGAGLGLIGNSLTGDDPVKGAVTGAIGGTSDIIIDSAKDA